jgi:hypothetical protein
MIMRQKTTRIKNLLFGALLLGAIPKCSCDEGSGIQRSSVQMRLTLMEIDPCLQQAVGRNIPDDYEAINLAAVTDFGSRGERFFEVRSVGTAPLELKSVSLSEIDEEFTIEILGLEDALVSLPVIISPSAEANGPAPVRIKVSYAATDSEPDSVKLLISTDDPKRSNIEFGLLAGKGKLQICGTNGCVDDARIDFGNIPHGDSASHQLVLKNVGEGDLDLRSLTLESISSEFCAPELTAISASIPGCALIKQCMSLKPGEEYVVNLTYSPTDGGEDTGVIRVVSGDAARGTVDVPINGVGSGPAVCACLLDGMDCNPVSTVDFGFVEINTTVTKTLRLVSCGTEAVTLTEAGLENDAMSFYNTDPEFSISMNFNTGVLQPNEFTDGEIVYAPTTGGQNRGGVRFAAMHQSAPSWVALLGRTATCDLEAVPMQLNFGAVAGGASADRTLILANNGAADCVLNQITDPSSPEFTILNPPMLPLTIAPGASQDLTLRYTSPVRMTSTGDMATLTVSSNEPAPDQTNTVTLVAQGGGAAVCALAVQPTGAGFGGRDGQLLFGAVNIGYSQTQSIRVNNVGNANCEITAHSMQVQEPSEFSMAAMPLPIVIPPQATGTIDVTFAPTHGPSGLFPWYGTILNYVDFTVAGPGLMQTDWSIGLRATPTEPSIDIIPGDLDFGVVTWDRPQAPDNRSSCGSEHRIVRVYNSGNGAMDVTSVYIDATSDSVFEITSVTHGGTALSAPYASTVPAGDNLELQLRFFPTRISPAQHNGLLVVENTVTMQSTVPLRGEGTSNSQQTDVFEQVADNKIDILWVIDDSGSMSEEQTALANNISWFIQYADMLNVDWQMGVTTTEVNDAVSGHIWACSGYSKIIRNTDADRVAAFSCAANVTFPPNGNRRPNPSGSDEQEAGLQAARIALDAPVRDNENAGFVRADARLAVIIVSDEEDQSQGATSLYVDFFKQIKGFRNPQLVTVSAIAGDVPGGCATADAAPRYHDVVGQMSGQFDSICNNDWSRMLQNIGLDVFALRTAWSLSRPADPATIVVRVAGNTVSGNSTNGWTFDSGSNAITFHGTAIPMAGQRIEVQYSALCLP